MEEQRGRRLEGWPNTAVRLAGWKRMNDPPGCDFGCDGRFMPLAQVWSCMLSYESLAIPAADAASL